MSLVAKRNEQSLAGSLNCTFFASEKDLAQNDFRFNKKISIFALDIKVL